MELFYPDGCLSEQGLHALLEGELDELGRLETAEHLAYCNKCMDRYTALLTADVLQEPPKSVRSAVMTSIWVRLMQNVYGRTAVATVAAVLALTMWRTGVFEQISNGSKQLKVWMPSTSQTLPETAEPKPLGKPIEDDAPKKSLHQKLTTALEEYFGSEPSPSTAADHPTTESEETKL